MASAGFVRASSGVALSHDQALVELGKAARELLLEVAATYRATISYHQLGVDVQRAAGIRAGHTPGWLVEVLTTVVHVCHRLAEPPLTSLVVGATDGLVGPAYDEVPRTAVSYTHLDVYKRQASLSAPEDRPRRASGRPRASAAVRRARSATTPGSPPRTRAPGQDPTPARAGPRPVSYTHLDVYKRQVEPGPARRA